MADRACHVVGSATHVGLTQVLADMIIDLPTEADFRGIGFQLLNMAWDTAATLLCDLDQADYYEVESDEVKDAYWQAARTQMSAALAVAQQGSEFLIKARIAAVSPYLLIASAPKDWPSGCATKPIAFADFRSIDAQDLIKTHNTVSSFPIDNGFVLEFEALRRKRNTILHSVNKHLNVHVAELLRSVLLVNEYLGDAGRWARLRHEYLESTPQSQMYSGDYADYRLVWEMGLVKDILSPSETKKFFGFDKKRRAYICPHCNYDLARDAEHDFKTAVLQPNTPISTKLFCFVCGTAQEIERTSCAEVECKGNVVSTEWERCLTCNAHVS